MEDLGLSGSSVLVTGAHGFLGAWLVQSLLSLGARVVTIRQDERVVSTLTARFKPEVGRIAAILLAGYYRGAAYLAHARPGRAYPPKPGVKDEYNGDQWLKVKVIWKRRKKRSP